jgi:hypothetical protein
VNAWRLIEAVWLVAIVAITLALVAALIGCTPAACIKPVVTIERPLLPEVQANRLAPLDDATYIDVVIRDRLLHEYAETLEVIVRELAEVTP